VLRKSDRHLSDVSPVKDKDGRVVGASKIARDISEQKRAQERQKLGVYS